MKTPYGLPIIDDCIACPIVANGAFCNLPDKSLEAWGRVRQNATHPRGAVLFVQGQAAAGMHVICMGQVKLFSSAPDGATVIHGIYNAGNVLGAAEALLGSSYDATAESITPCVVSFIKRDALTALLRSDSEIAFRLTSQLSAQLTATRRQIENQRLHRGSLERLAHFLLDYCDERLSVSMTLTHQEIGEIIGLSRETVTRGICEMKNRNIIRITGHLTAITDRDALVRLAGDI